MRGILAAIAVGQSGHVQDAASAPLDWGCVPPHDAQLSALRKGLWCDSQPVRLPLSPGAAGMAMAGATAAASASAQHVESLHAQLDEAVKSLAAAREEAERAEAGARGVRERAVERAEDVERARALSERQRAKKDRVAFDALRSEAVALRKELQRARAEASAAYEELSAAQQTSGSARARAAEAESRVKARGGQLRMLASAKSAALGHMQEARAAQLAAESERDAMAARLELARRKLRAKAAKQRLAQQEQHDAVAHSSSDALPAEQRSSGTSAMARAGASPPRRRSAKRVGDSTEHKWRRECLELRRRCRALERENTAFRRSGAVSAASSRAPSPARSSPRDSTVRSARRSPAAAAAAMRSQRRVRLTPRSSSAATPSSLRSTGADAGDPSPTLFSPVAKRGVAARAERRRDARTRESAESVAARAREVDALVLSLAPVVEAVRVSDFLYRVDMTARRGADGGGAGYGSRAALVLNLRLDVDARGGGLVVGTLDGDVAFDDFLAAAALCD